MHEKASDTSSDILSILEAEIHDYNIMNNSVSFLTLHLLWYDISYDKLS